MTAALPPLVQDNGLPFDLFIQSLTEQLDRAQAAMAVKARVAKLPLTFAVKDLSLDLRAFVSIVNDDLYIRPAGPGDREASTLTLALTTITRPMVEENAIDFHADDQKFGLRETLGDTLNEEDRRSLERIGIRTVKQLNDLKRSAGADVIARLSRLPVNRLQQALLRAAQPQVTHIETESAPVSAPDQAIERLGGLRNEAAPTAPSTPALRSPLRARLGGINLLQGGRAPLIRATGREVPIVMAQEHELVVEPHASQFGQLAEVDYGNGQVFTVQLPDAPPVGHIAGHVSALVNGAAP